MGLTHCNVEYWMQEAAAAVVLSAFAVFASALLG